MVASERQQAGRGLTYAPAGRASVVHILVAEENKLSHAQAHARAHNDCSRP